MSTTPAALILGANGHVGGYLARLLQARGRRIAVVTDPAIATADALAALGIAGDVETVAAADAVRFAGSGEADTVFAIGGETPPEHLAEILAAAAAGTPPRFVNIVEAAALRHSPAARTLARHVADLRRDRKRLAANAILHAHDSRLGPAGSMPAIAALTAARIAAGLATTPLELVESGPQDWGWTAEYVDAIARLAALPRPVDIEIGSGHTLTTAEIVRHAFDYFKIGVADHVRILPAAAAAIAPGPIDTAALKAVTGWSATTHGRDLVRTLSEGAATRADTGD